MSATELATAYINLVPSFKGGKAAIAKELSGAEAAAGASGKQTGAKFASGMKGGLALAGGFAAAGAGMLKLGSDFQGAYKTIRVGTGATGKDLRGLKSDFKQLLAVRPDSMEKVSSAITGVSKSTHLTGKPLQELTKQYLQLSGATGTDLQGNIKTTGQLFTNYSVATGKQADKLDLLYRASQKGKLSVAEIATAMTKAGPVARQLGLDFDDTAGLVSMLSNAGVDISDVMPAMSKTIKSAAASGKDAGKVFRDSFSSIRNAKSDTAAAGLAVDAFGAKAGPKLAGLIREGKLSYADFVAGLKTGKDTIASTASDTGTAAGKFKTLKNSFAVALEPFASGAFDSANKMLADWAPRISAIVSAGAGMPGWVHKVALGLVLLVPAVKVFGKIHKGVTSTISALSKMRDAMSKGAQVGGKLFSMAKSGASTLGGWAKSGASAAVGIAKTTAAWVAQKAALVAQKVATLAMSAASKVAAAAQWALNAALNANPVTLIVIAIAALVAGLVLAYKKVGWFHDFVDAAFRGIASVVGWVVNFIKSHWQLLVAILTGPIGIAVLLITRNWDTIKAGFRAVKEFIGNRVTEVVGFINGIKARISGAVSTMWDGLKTGVRLVRDYIRSRIDQVVGFVKGLPERIGSVADRLKSILLSPFKLAFKGIASLWNATIGKLSFKAPSWLPKFGGNGWSMPNIDTGAFDKYHRGGVVPGHGEVPILAMGQERVLTAAQNRAYEKWMTGGGQSAGGAAGRGGFNFDGANVTFGDNSRRTVRDLELWDMKRAQEVMAG